MRTYLVFNNVDASISQSVEIPINTPDEKNPQDLRFLLQASKSGTDGNPRVILEESIDRTIWTALEDTETWENYTDLVGVLGIKDNYFMGKYLRIRLEPNGTTTGTVYSIFGYKTKP